MLVQIARELVGRCRSLTRGFLNRVRKFDSCRGHSLTGGLARRFPLSQAARGPSALDADLVVLTA